MFIDDRERHTQMWETSVSCLLHSPDGGSNPQHLSAPANWAARLGLRGLSYCSARPVSHLKSAPPAPSWGAPTSTPFTYSSLASPFIPWQDALNVCLQYYRSSDLITIMFQIKYLGHGWLQNFLAGHRNAFLPSPMTIFLALLLNDYGIPSEHFSKNRFVHKPFTRISTAWC